MEHPVSYTFEDDLPQQRQRSSSPHRRAGAQRSRAKPNVAPPSPPADAGVRRTSGPSAPPPRSLPPPPPPRRNGASSSGDRGASPARETAPSRPSRTSDDARADPAAADGEFERAENPSADATSLSSQRELNMLQQHAMNEFLEAQLSGCPVEKEEKWRELVRAMKDQEMGYRGRRGSRSRGSRSRSRSRGSNRSWGHEILGFIRIGGGASVGGEESTASGLTSPTTSPMVSPVERRRCSLPSAGGGARGGSISPETNDAGRNVFSRSNGASSGTPRSEAETLPTFPSLPGYREESLGRSLPTFPSLPGDNSSRPSDDDEGNLRRSSVASDHDEEHQNNAAVFLDIGQAAAAAKNPLKPLASKESSTWDSLLLSSSENDDPSFAEDDRVSRSSSDRTNSIVKNLIGRYETSINRSVHSSFSSGKERGFFQRTNSEVIQSQKMMGSHPRVVSGSNPISTLADKSPAAAASASPQKEALNQSQLSSSQRTRKKSTLEDQIRNVLLEQQQTHTDNECTDRFDAAASPTSDVLSGISRPLNRPNHLKRSGSVASAQDILAELRRSPTPTSLISGKSFGSGGKPSLPRSISVGGGVGSPPRGSASSPVQRGVSSPERGVRCPSPKLAPSRRDLPRPSRLTRKSASEPIAVALLYADLGVAVNELNDSFKVGSPLRMGNTQAGNASEVFKAPVPGSHNKVFPCTSPLTVRSDETSKNISTPARSPGSASPSRTKATPSPTPQLPPSRRDVPTISSTRRILPSVKEIAARLNGPMKSKPATFSSPSQSMRKESSTNIMSINSPGTASAGSRDRIDEIRASISMLKHNGVGGIGKATSTLVRNRETGRYIIRDVDDESFDDIMLKEMMRPQVIEDSFELDPRDVLEEEELEQFAPTNSLDAVVGDVSSAFRTSLSCSISGSVMSDGAVDEAVRAAIDAISSTSTDDIVERNQSPSPHPRNVPSPTHGADEDDFFVVAKSSNKWSSFQKAANDSRGPFLVDAFDINPSTDNWDSDGDGSFACAQWDDSGSDEWRDEKNSSGLVAANNFKTSIVPSPTSVMIGPNRKMMRDGKVKQQQAEVVPESWDPFGE